MSIQLTPFAWVLGAMICALPVAAFLKTKYPSFSFARARGRVSSRENISAQGQASTSDSGSALDSASGSAREKDISSFEERTRKRKKREKSPSTPGESSEGSFFARFIEQWFKLAFVFEIFVFMFTNLGYFVKINDAKVGYAFVASIVLFALSVCMICMGKVDKKILWCGVALMVAIGISALSCAVRPYQPGVIYEFDDYVSGKPYGVYLPKANFLMFKTAFSFLRTVAALSVARKVFFSRGQWATLSGVFARFIRLIVCVGIVEFFIKKFGNVQPVQDFLNRFLGEAVHTHFISNRLQGLYKEPSHYSIYLSLCGFLLVARLCGLKNGAARGSAITENLTFFFVCALLIISSSFGGLFYAALLLVMYFWFYVSPKGKFFWTWGFLLLAAAAIVAVGCTSLKTKWNLDHVYERTSSFFYSLLSLLKGDESTVTSEGARLTSIFFAFKWLSARPLFGVGLSVADVHSTFVSLLADIGLAGVFFWIFFGAKFASATGKSALFETLVYLSMCALGGTGFAFPVVLPVIFLFAEQQLPARKKQTENAEKPAKILMISGAMPPMSCGVGDYTAKLCGALQQGGDYSVVALTSVGAAAQISGAETVKIRNEIQTFGGFAFLRFVRRVLKEEKPDIVHFQFPSSQYRGRSLPVFLWLPLMLKRASCKVVFTAHEYNDKKIPFITAPFMLCADKIITVEDGFSKKIARNLKPFIDKNKVAYVPIGSNISLSRADETKIEQIRERVLGGKTEQKILGYFGFIGEGKCFDMLLEACGSLKEKNALSCKIMIVGKIDKEKCGEKYYEKLAAVIEKYSLGESIYETGYLPEAEVADYIKAADFFALPFKNGAACRNGSILAAAQEGKRVISSRGALTGEFFNSGQFVLIKNSVAAWEEAIRAELSADTAAAYEATVPSWEEIAKEHARIYRDVTENPLIDGERTEEIPVRKRAKKKKTEGGDERSD